MNPLLELIEHGQSYWLDNLTRPMVRGGELERRVREEGLRGVTSNPAIFQKAISGGGDYDDHIEELVERRLPVSEIYEELTVTDIREACDVLRPVWEASEGDDGYVSLEVSPYLARDTGGSIEEARRLFGRVDRPNVMIKIPGTVEGLPAIEELLFEGVNVNVTLLFSVERYEAVARAYLQALGRRREAGRPLDEVASVASFFLSRIDVLVDRLLGDRIRSVEAAARDVVGDDAARDEAAAGPPEIPQEAGGAGAVGGRGAAALDPRDLLGRAAIANAKRAYRSFQRIFSGERWERLADDGARVQRVLWASTSTKDPLYSDVRYVESLIGPHTVNTLPDRTIRAFADHGRAEDTLTGGGEEAERTLAGLASVGIDVDGVTSQLEDEGIRKFVDPYDRLMGTLARRRRMLLGPEGCRERYRLGSEEDAVESVLESLRMRRWGRRLWAKDASLWTEERDVADAIRDRLGWLDSVELFRDRLDELEAFAEEVRGQGIRHAVLLGMGGSSLGAEVSRDVFGAAEGGPELLVLDNTDPAAIRAVEDRIELEETLFLVASKSGTTAETTSFYRHFRARLEEAGVEDVGRRFVAITDPGTPLAEEARDRGFRRCFENPEDIGGRYSVLSWFGLVPMAVVGIDVAAVLDAADQMRVSCGPLVPPAENPGVRLGAALATWARAGRDKVTLVATGAAGPFGAWLEQLLAESTGKDGKGLVPVVDEPLADADAYRDDRVFVHLHVDGAGRVGETEPAAEEVTARLDELADAGHPVVRLEPASSAALGAEFFRWEVATATAGAVLGLNPFDEPNVAEAKRRTRELLAASGEVAADEPEEGDAAPVAADDALSVHAAGAATRLSGGAGPDMEELGHGSPEEPVGAVQRFLSLADPGDYVSLQVYLPRTPARHETLQELRTAIRDRQGVATTLGYGPRYLHSTGQLHKGGPNRGLHLLITREAADDLPIPGEEHGFGELQRAQALGDLRSLAARGRRVLRIHLRDDVDEGLERLARAVRAVPAGR